MQNITFLTMITQPIRIPMEVRHSLFEHKQNNNKYSSQQDSEIGDCVYECETLGQVNNFMKML